MVFGSVIASFAVEEFGVEGLLRMRREAIEERFELLREYTSFAALEPSAVSRQPSGRSRVADR
jgi:hypothetical protein